ncbi:MAG: S8 family serine peptidase [Phycisphaerales bacterium]
MSFQRAVCIIGSLAIAGSCWGQQDELIPRRPTPKTPTARLVAPIDATGRLIIKFRDVIQARAQGDGTVLSLSNANLNQFGAVIAQHQLQVTPAFRTPQASLLELQTRAAAYSGKAQPDLAGMMYVSGDWNQVQAAAKILNDLDTVEWVEFEKRLVPYQVAGPACGVMGTGSCFDPAGNGSPFCDDQACCDLICAGDPFCCDVDIGTWDEICAGLANLYCDTPPADRCTSFLNESCFEQHQTGGCLDETCCNAVCMIDPSCCTDFWDDMCVSMAAQDDANCAPGCQGGNGPTADLTNLQGYLRVPDYVNQPGGAPACLAFPAPSFPGYGGHGWNLQGPGYPMVADPDPYEGLYGLSRQLFEVFGVGETNPPGSNDFDDLVYNTLGKGIKIAVIEWAYFEDHEDLNVITEPGQTLIMIDWITEPDHATACLGIINARDNGKGVIGIAPEAQAYFFPLTSIEDGPRFSKAFINTYLTLGPGDVVSCSFGPGVNLNNSRFFWELLRLGSDLGITTCVAAGNGCDDLGEFDDLGDSGAIVVGAGTPGIPHCRLTFSNYFQDGDSTNSNVIHVQAWGQNVASTGYGDLWVPSDGDPNRAYTARFNGTSAATPQIAALVADLQGLARQFYGIPLTPEQIRAAVSRGFNQCGIFDPDDLPGFPDEFDCAPDFDPDAGPNQIGPYPTTTGDFGSAAAFILNQDFPGFGDSPLIDDIEILRGTLIFGNVFSIKGTDNNRLVIKSQFTNPTDNIDLGIVYLASGQITDLLVIAHSDVPNASSLVIVHEAQSSNGFPDCDPPLSGSALVFFEMYDWDINRWMFVAFDNLMSADPPDLDCLIPAYPVPNGGRFIRSGDGRILLRIWTLSLGGNFGGFGGLQNAPYVIRHDWINILLGGADGGPTIP